jgi:hypothetical protein
MCDPSVEEHAEPKYPVDAVDLRAVRILRGFALGVVLAMDRTPIPWSPCRGKPEPSRKKCEPRVQVERAVRLIAVQIDRHRRDVTCVSPSATSTQAHPRKIKHAGEKS